MRNRMYNHTFPKIESFYNTKTKVLNYIERNIFTLFNLFCWKRIENLAKVSDSFYLFTL